jgi:hypothetical protein
VTYEQIKYETSDGILTITLPNAHAIIQICYPIEEKA